MIALLFLIVFMLQAFSKAILVFSYYLNVQAFAKHCVNKQKPKLRCQGKCQLMKCLNQEEKQEEQNPERKVDNSSEIILSSRSFFPEIICFFTRYRLLFPLEITRDSPGMPRLILRPPIA